MPIITDKTKLLERKKSINPDYMSQEEAIKYAAKRGIDDSIRGIQQMYGQVTNNEELLDALKAKDEKLNKIFENEEYGGKALAAWMGTTVALDPIGMIPLIGWGRKAKQMQKGASYGASLGENVRASAGIGAAWGGVGYYGEEDMTRGEGVLIGGALGGALGYGVGKVSQAVNKSLSPSRTQKQEMSAQKSAEDIRAGKQPTPDEIEKIRNSVVEELLQEGPSKLNSISGLNIRKNYEDIAGSKVWNAMVANWGSGLVGMAAASGGYSALDDPEASELQKFGAALALGLAAGASTKIAGKLQLKDGSTLSEFISKGMVDNYGLDPDFIKIKKSTYSEVGSLKQQFLDIIRATDKTLSDDEQQVLYSMIHGVMDDVPTLKGLSDSAKAVIKDTGRQLVDVGLLAEETWRKNAGKYLHRSYDSKLLKEAGGTQAVRAAREFKIIGDELKPRGIPAITTKKAFEKPDSHWQKAGWEVLDDSDPENYIVRRQLTKQERLDRGEIENASFALAETGRLMTHDLAVFKLFKNISSSKFAIDEDTFLKQSTSGDIIPGAWLQVPTTTRYKGKSFEVNEYGKLAGMYVPKEVLEDVTRLIPTAQNGFKKLIGAKYINLMKIWKKSKTAWNPTVHVNNTMSNVMMYDHANGSYKFLKRGAQELKKGLDERTDATIFRMAKEDGVLDSDILTRELNDETMGALEKAVGELSRKGRNELHGSINYSKKLGDFFQGAYEKTFRKMENFYQAEDQVFRMALYMDRLSKGASRADAAADAKKWFIDYDINAPLINFMKNGPTPFISYTYRVVPLLAETAAKRPWKFAKWAAMGFTANDLGNKYGVGDEDAERRLMDERFKQPMFGVPIMPSTTIKTPFASGRDKDVPLYIDTTRFIPGGDIFTMGNKSIPLPVPVPFSKSITGQQKMLSLPSSINPNFGIAGEILAPMMFGVDPFTHEKLEGLGLGNDEMVKMQHVLSRLNPNIPAPYILPEKYESFSSKKIREAYENTVNDKKKKYGADLTPFEAIMSSFGFKLQPMEIEKLLRIEDSNFRRVYSQARRDYFKAMQEYQLNPTSENKEKAQNKVDKIYEQLENAQRKYKAKRKPKVEGGKISKDFPVSDVKENPQERRDPFAQQSYSKTREGFALGGDVDEFTPLAQEVEQLAAMQSVEGADVLNQGVMPLEKLERKKYNEGNKAVSSRILKSLRQLADEGVYRFEPERGAEKKDGTFEPDYLANKGDGKADFVMMVYNNAKALGLKHPEMIAAQAAAESRYGASALAQGSNNLFGIKLREGEEGPAKMYPTKEQYADGLKQEMANFREFNSIDESIQGYDTFLRTGVKDDGSPRYDKALEATTPIEYLNELKNAGYATDDDYVTVVGNVYNQYFGNK